MTNDDDRGNLQYVTNDEPSELGYNANDQGGNRNRQRIPSNTNNLRKGPPLQGLLDYDGGFGYSGRDCRVRTLPHDQYCDIYYYQNVHYSIGKFYGLNEGIAAKKTY